MSRRSPIDALYRRPGFLLRRAHQIASGVFERECGAWGLTQAQHGALVVARCCPGIDQTGIALALGFDRATAGEVLRVLEGRGLIERAPSAKDARRRTIVVTPEGEALLRRAAPALARAQARLLSPLSASKRKELVSLLASLCESFNRESRAPLERPESP